MPGKRKHRTRLGANLDILRDLSATEGRCRCGFASASPGLHAAHAEACPHARLALQRATWLASTAQHLCRLQKHELSHTEVDKAFCSTWLNDSHIIVGTKSNQLMLLDLGRASGRGAHAIRSSLLTLPNFYNGGTSGRQDSTKWAGMHAVAVSPDGQMLACGGADVTDGLVLGLPDLQPQQHLSEHQDWIFGTDWITDRHVITSDRLGTLCVWHVHPHGEKLVGRPKPQQMASSKDGAARDLKCDVLRQRIVTVHCDSDAVTFWDPSLTPVHTYGLDDRELPMAVGVHAETGVCAVVGSDYLYLIDPRSHKGILREIHGDRYGMRCVGSHGCTLSLGGSSVGLLFYDLRRRGWAYPDGQVACTPAIPPALSREDGSYDEDDPQLVSFITALEERLKFDAGRAWTQYVRRPTAEQERGDFGATELMSIYTHCWQPGGGRIYLAGGPLNTHRSGCNAALYGL